jgi:transcriptional regulator with XRE-family HTH domain
MAVRKSEGSRLLGKVNAQTVEIGAALGVTHSIVSQWSGGTKRPGDRNRAELFRLYGIPEDSWDREPGRPRVEPPAPSLSPAEPHGGEAERRLRSVLAELDAMDPTTLSDQARLRRASTIAQCSKLLGHATGESQDLSESRLLRLPALRRIVEAIRRALVPWPDAMQRVAEELERIGGER